MKTLILATALTILAPALAHAGYLCDSGEKNPGTEYYLIIPTPNTQVTIATQTPAGPRALTTISCTPVAITPPAGQILPIVFCSDKSKPNTGYVVIVYSGGLPGISSAVLSERDASGPHIVSRLVCYRRP